MPGVYEKTELLVTTENKTGTLAKVTAPIAESGINLNAFCAWNDGNKAYFMMITNNNDKAKEVLKKAGYTYEERTVVAVETTNEVGTMFKAAQNLANANIDLNYCYATTATEDAATWIVFGTDNIGGALNAIS